MPCTAQVQEAVDALAEAEGGGDSQDLYREHAGPLLERLAESQQGWTVHSPELLQFVALVTHAGEPPTNQRAPAGCAAPRPLFKSYSQSGPPVRSERAEGWGGRPGAGLQPARAARHRRSQLLRCLGPLGRSRACAALGSSRRRSLPSHGSPHPSQGSATSAR